MEAVAQSFVVTAVCAKTVQLSVNTVEIIVMYVKKFVVTVKDALHVVNAISSLQKTTNWENTDIGRAALV